jgi:hypothetical protein
VKRSVFKRGGDPPGSSHAFVLPSCIAPFQLSSPQMGCTVVAFVLLLLEERDLVGVGAFQPSLGFKDFRRAARLHSLTNGQFGGEKQAGLRPPPRPQLQRFSSSLLWRRASRVGTCLCVGSGPLLPSVIWGEGRSPPVALGSCHAFGSPARAALALLPVSPPTAGPRCATGCWGVAQHVVRREGGVRVLGVSAINPN